MSLDRDEVVDAAVAILDEYGMGDLSMRRLADALGVKAGALYWHVANKQSLLAAVADRVLSELAPVSGGGHGALVAWAHDLRRVLLAHRDSADLVATALASGLCQVDPVSALLPLLEPELPPQHVQWGAQAMVHLVLGHVAEEQNAALFAELGKGTGLSPEDQEGAFRYAAEALATGILATG